MPIAFLPVHRLSSLCKNLPRDVCRPQCRYSLFILQNPIKETKLFENYLLPTLSKLILDKLKWS